MFLLVARGAGVWFPLPSREPDHGTVRLLVIVHSPEGFSRKTDLDTEGGVRRQRWHVVWNHGRSHRSSVAGSSGHHPPVAGEDCRVGGAGWGAPAAGEG